MLNIKRNGLFYKWLNFSSTDFTYRLNSNRVTLCNLFWSSVWYAVLQIGALAFISLLGFGMGSVISAFFSIPFAAGITPWYVLLGLSIAGVLVIAGILTIVALAGWSAAKLSNAITEWRESKSFDRSLKESKARDEELRFGNIYQKMKIYKKDKLCPLIRVDHGE